MKTTLIVISLCLSTFCAAQSAPANPPAQDQGPPAGQEAPREGRRPPGIAGSIAAIEGNTLTIKTRDGQSVQVTVSDKTQYRRNREAASLADFKAGDMVFVGGTKTGDNAWQADMVGARTRGEGPDNFRDAMGKRFIAGEVKSINGTQLTILRPDGVTQTISVDEETSFRKDGESITLADFKAGDHVFGRGEVKNGTFVPAILNLGEPKFGMRRGNEPAEPN